MSKISDDLRAAAARLNDLATEGSDHDKAHLLYAHADAIERVTADMRENGGWCSQLQCTEWARALTGEPRG